MTTVLEKEEDYDTDAKLFAAVKLNLSEKKSKVDVYDRLEYEEILKEQRECKCIFQDNKYIIYALIITYCSNTMQMRIKTDTNFESKMKQAVGVHQCQLNRWLVNGDKLRR